MAMFGMLRAEGLLVNLKRPSVKRLGLVVLLLSIEDGGRACAHVSRANLRDVSGLPGEGLFPDRRA